LLSGYPALLTLDRRHELRAVIGAPAEEIVYRYGSCDRAATYPSAGRTFRDRFTGGTPALSAADWRAFAALTAANELDLALVSPGFLAAEEEYLRRLVTWLRPLLGAPALAGWAAVGLA
jgi:hypothetical protein